MTCEDFIHFTEEHNTQYADFRVVSFMQRGKKLRFGFEPKDNSWESVSK